MSKVAELRGKMNAATNELSALAQKDERSADEESRLDALLAEINDLGPKLQREMNIDAAATAARANGQSNGRVAGTIPTEGAEEREKADKERDTRTLGQRFVQSEQWEDFRRRGARGKMQPLPVGSFYRQHAAEVEHRDGMGPDEVRALIQTGGLPADYIMPQSVPGFFRGDDLQGTIRDALINGTTTSDAIVFFRELVYTNAAAAVAQATATTGATGLKPESSLTFEQATANVVTIAHWIPITRQTLDDAAQIRTYVEQRLVDGLRLEESDQLLNGDGVGANMTGLRLTTNVQYLTTAGEFTTTPAADAGTANENFNRILRGRTKVRTVGRARSNFVVLNPTDLEQMLTYTDANRQYHAGGPFGGTAIPRLWGLRVVEDENMPENEALVGDGRFAAVWDRMQAQVLADTIDDQFVRNMLTLLAEERLALTVFRPTAFCRVELVA